MGQQQLLLIVLGTIVVIIAIVIGIDLFSASAPESNRDHVISVLTALSSELHAYYNKETQYGGGGDSYIGWQLPKSFKKHENGKNFVKARIRKNRVALIGYGTEIGNNGRNPVRIRLIVRPTGTQLRILN